MSVRRAPLLLMIVATLAACSSGRGTTGSAPAPGSSAPSASTVATRIEVKLTDALKIEPAAMTVRSVVPVTFVVTNSGTTDHEFYLGDEAAQAAHEKEMAEMGGMGHDDPAGMAVKPGETKELTYTFDAAGQTLAGCHVAGHYGGGMMAVVTVE